MTPRHTGSTPKYTSPALAGEVEARSDEGEGGVARTTLTRGTTLTRVASAPRPLPPARERCMQAAAKG